MSPIARVRALLGWVGRYELGLLLAIGAVSLGTWAFVAIADEVRDGDTQDLDRRLLLSLRTADDLSDPLGPRWLEEVVATSRRWEARPLSVC